MTRAISQTAVERLALDLAERSSDESMAEELVVWLSGSPRFRSFAEAHRDKIRKKFRNATDPETLRDVRTELQVARLLLADRRFELAFESYGSGKAGPDFTISFRGGRPFNLEVTRLRAPRGASAGSALLAKLRQLPPSAANAVLLAIDGDSAAAVDVDAIVRALRSRADAKDEAFFIERGVAGSRVFYERFLRLGGVIVWCEAAGDDARATFWINSSARIAIPDRAIRTAVQLLRA